MSRSTPVPKYRHHKGTGQAFVQVKGRRFYLGKHNSPASKEAYARFVAEIAAKPVSVPIAPTKASDVQVTVVELAAAYLDFAEGYYVKDGRPTGELPVIRRALIIVNELYGRQPAVEFGPLALRAVQQKLIQDHYARKTVNHFVAVIRRLFRWAASQELISVVTYQALTTVPGLKKGRSAAREPDPVRPVADEVVDATLPFLPKVPADMVRFQRLTGCRPTEVCTIRPIDVDRSGEVWLYRPASHKTSHRDLDRVVFIGPKAQQILLPYLLRDAQTYCFSPADSEAHRHAEQREQRKTRLQPSQVNRRKRHAVRTPKAFYTKDSFNRAIRRAVDKANASRAKQGSDLLPVWHPNQLRHSTATEIRRQFGLEAAQVILGHTTANTTEIYAERDLSLARDVIRKIG